MSMPDDDFYPGDRVRVQSVWVPEKLQGAEATVTKVGPLWSDSPHAPVRMVAFLIFDDEAIGGGIMPLDLLERI